MKDYDDISIELSNYIANITIHRPPNNFFDSYLIQQIADAYEELDNVDECRVILLCSEGKNFCAGANFAKLGFHQGFGSSVTLPRVVGIQHSADMLYTARRVKGEEALKMGLIDKITSKETLLEESIKFAMEIASSAPMAIESIRSTLKGDLADQVEKVVDWELSEQIRLQKTEDFKEGIASSLERRQPNFSRK